MKMLKKNENMWENKWVIPTKLLITQWLITLENQTGYQSNAKTLHSLCLERYEKIKFLYSLI